LEAVEDLRRARVYSRRCFRPGWVDRRAEEAVEAPAQAGALGS
jgi:hypothetical protein